METSLVVLGLLIVIIAERMIENYAREVDSLGIKLSKLKDDNNDLLISLADKYGRKIK